MEGMDRWKGWIGWIDGWWCGLMDEWTDRQMGRWMTDKWMDTGIMH